LIEKLEFVVFRTTRQAGFYRQTLFEFGPNSVDKRHVTTSAAGLDLIQGEICIAQKFVSGLAIHWKYCASSADVDAEQMFGRGKRVVGEIFADSLTQVAYGRSDILARDYDGELIAAEAGYQRRILDRCTQSSCKGA